MRSLLTQLLAVGPELAVFILSAPLLSTRGVRAQETLTAVPSPDLDLSSLGRVAIGGDFDSISLYQYEGQNENLSSNGSQSLLTRYPDGTFQSLGLVDADSAIATMCTFISRDGTNNGVVVGGNFTSLGGVEATSIALWNTNTSTVEPLAGLSGPVRALYCDRDSSTVYVGGYFMGGNSTNALAWKTGWVNLPFAGFNGPVNSITKNSAGNIVFAGQFDGLGNATTPNRPDAQVINLGSGNISASGTTTSSKGSNPRSIICSTSQSGDSWLLADNTAGWWEGDYGFGFNPTKLRLYNANEGGRGTKSFYFERLNDGGILNLTYVDPTTGNTETCIQSCPLPENNSTAQDFHFVNVNSVGMSKFRIYVTEWYGDGGGLSGMEMFQDDIYSYAVNAFNEPRCDGVSNGSSSTAAPNNLWNVTSNSEPADYLTASLSESSQVNSTTKVVFLPNIQQSGNYSVTVYTPGCIVDGTCSTRGQVNLTGSMTTAGPPITTTLFQTNNYDKYDQIYYGYIDVDSDTFAPSVTISPVPGQSVPLTVVASRVRFELISSTGGLNGLFEYNPNDATVETDFSKSAVDRAGAGLNAGAIFASVVQYQDTTFAAGNFSGDGISNIMSITDNGTALPGGGLDGPVVNMLVNDSTLYVVGMFNNTPQNTVPGLSGVATYSISDKKWATLGAGVGGGGVFDIVPLQLNISSTEVADCFAFTGNFSSVNAFSGHDSFSADGFAVWVPSAGNWLNNIPEATVALQGKLTTYTTVPNEQPLYGGTISSQGLNYSSAVQLVGSGEPTIESLGLRLQSSSSDTASKRKRALTPQDVGRNYTGVYDGIFYQENSLNITVLGGNFAATASNGSTVENLVFINNTGTPQTVSGAGGLDTDSIFITMDTYNTQLFAGGFVNGTVHGARATGLVVYDLSKNDFIMPHPPALQGDNVIVNAIATRPDNSYVFVGGDFDQAGSLPCETLCMYATDVMQWQTVGSGLTGVINVMVWTSKNQLVIAGNLTVNGNQTFMATYDAKKQTFSEYTGASGLPGPITTLSAVSSDYNEWWAAGTATSNSPAYLYKYSGSTWTAAGGLGATSKIRKLQIMPLTSNHDTSSLMAQDQDLMILGSINIPNQGNASAVLFNGTTYEPYLITDRDNGDEGSLTALFVSNPQNLMASSGGHLALGLVVLIALAIALALVCLLVIAGLLIERRRRLQEGYVPIGESRVDKSTNIARLPPETLLQNLESKTNAPQL